MRFDKIGTMLLLVATLVVGVSIMLNDGAARVLNGLGGVAWFAAAAVLGIASTRSSRSPQQWAAAVLLTTLVAFVIKPSDLVLAIVGFGLAGAVMVWLSPSHDLLWATFIVALYLPFHIGAAVVRMIGRSLAGIEATIRTDPPPTAPLVPLVMVIAAIGGGLIGQRLARSRHLRLRDRLVPDV